MLNIEDIVIEVIKDTQQFALSYIEAKLTQKIKLETELQMAKDQVKDLERDLKNVNEMIDLLKINQDKAL